MPLTGFAQTEKSHKRVLHGPFVCLNKFPAKVDRIENRFNQGSLTKIYLTDRR